MSSTTPTPKTTLRRGGARAGAGRKPGGPPLEVAPLLPDDLEGLPEPPKILLEPQASGSPEEWEAPALFHTAAAWMKARGALAVCPVELLTRYAIAAARLRQAEQLLSREGLTVFRKNGEKAPHPALKAVSEYSKQAGQVWLALQTIVQTRNAEAAANAQQWKFDGEDPASLALLSHAPTSPQGGHK